MLRYLGEGSVGKSGIWCSKGKLNLSKLSNCQPVNLSKLLICQKFKSISTDIVYRSYSRTVSLLKQKCHFFLQNVLVLKVFCCSFSLSLILPNLYHQPRFASFIGSSAVWHSNDIESLARRPVSPEHPPECLYFEDRRSNNELRKSSKNFNKHTFSSRALSKNRLTLKVLVPKM